MEKEVISKSLGAHGSGESLNNILFIKCRK